MKHLLLISILSVGLFYGSCQNKAASDNNKFANLTVEEFEKQINEGHNYQLIDVRTPEEFSEGHLYNSLNINYNSNDFESQISKQDKTKTTYVYCLSGGRSAAAVNKMKSMGFTEVHNLEGGILKWKSAGKSIETNPVAGKDKSLTKEAFEKLISSENYVLVDYQAVWCAPCKKMAPILEKIANARKEKLTLVKIDIDENAAFASERGIDEIPLLELYKNGKLVWKHLGYIDEKTILKETHL